MGCLLQADPATASESPRQQVLLSDTPWQFVGAGGEATLPAVSSIDFERQKWETVQLPHVFQTRAHYKELMQGFYRRDLTVPPEWAGRRLYLMFEGAATIADVYVNGQHLGQHRGAYTRFIFDATAALHPGKDNALVVQIDNDLKKNGHDCLPDSDNLYKVWGGLYRKVWLIAVDPLHIDPTDYASPGVYITTQNVSESGADLSVEVLVRNASTEAQAAEVRATVLDAAGQPVKVLKDNIQCAPNQRSSVTLKGNVLQPKLWAPGAPNLYHVLVEIVRDGKVTDSITQPLGFRQFVFDPKGRTTINGKPVKLAGGNLHQEIESKASAMTDDDFRANYALVQDLGYTFIRLPHYPHAQVEYDLCDRLGLVCWAENGHSNDSDVAGPTAESITTEMVKQNYNHPSIAIWSVGNEAGAKVAEAMVPVVKALDSTRPVVVANMKCANADFHGQNAYPGWYQGHKAEDGWKLKVKGYISETGAGGVTTTHCDYAAPTFKMNKYEPEEYQQLLCEALFQRGIAENDGSLGIFALWTTRDFNDHKYKGSIGWNTKGLLTYAGEKKDVYYLYRCFLRPDEPTLHITSKKYFIREGAVDNGIKVYSSAQHVTLTLNGEKVSTLENGQYLHEGKRRVDHVFYWPAPLRTGRNDVSVSDDAGHTDTAPIYFYGAGGAPEVPVQNPLVDDLQTSNPANVAHFMDMPVQAQWPIYYDLDGNADNSFDELPKAIEGARWIATRNVMKPGQESDLSFKVTRPVTVYVACTKGEQAPAYLANAGFKEVNAPGFVWRDNSLQLVPAQLFSRTAAAGETVHLAQSDRDQIVMVKE